MFTLQSKVSCCLMPLSMCWDSICTVAEVRRCSQYYLWLFDGGFLLEAYTAVYCYHVVFSEVAKST